MNSSSNKVPLIKPKGKIIRWFQTVHRDWIITQKFWKLGRHAWVRGKLHKFNPNSEWKGVVFQVLKFKSHLRHRWRSHLWHEAECFVLGNVIWQSRPAGCCFQTKCPCRQYKVIEHVCHTGVGTIYSGRPTRSIWIGYSYNLLYYSL